MLPATLPANLTAAALASGQDFAWPVAVSADVVDWLAANGYAVLGTELWVIKPNGNICSLPVGESGTAGVYGNTVNRQQSEPWQAFVARSHQETVAYLRSFKSSAIREGGKCYFNIVFVSEQDFSRRSPHGRPKC